MMFRRERYLQVQRYGLRQTTRYLEPDVWPRYPRRIAVVVCTGCRTQEEVLRGVPF
jgi:hypothetical protein